MTTILKAVTRWMRKSGRQVTVVYDPPPLSELSARRIAGREILVDVECADGKVRRCYLNHVARWTPQKAFVEAVLLSPGDQARRAA